MTLICQVFWQKGYHQTSIQDLVEITGLQRGSLYSAFGNKQALFRLALTFYADTVEQQVMKVDDPELLVRSWFGQMLSRSAEALPARGCLMLNSMSELQHLEPEEREVVLGHVQRIEDVFCYCIVGTHRKVGRVFAKDFARDHAKSLVATLIGLSILSRSGQSRVDLQKIATHALDSALQTMSQ